MKAIFISNSTLNEDLASLTRDDEFFILMNEYDIMESPVLYFSAGDAKIKEILIKKEPTFSI
jgi:hypothetical protein